MERATITRGEAAFVLGRSYMQVVRMIRRGELEEASTGICAASVERALGALSPGERPLRLQALGLLRARRIRVPQPRHGRWGMPVPITVLPTLLAPAGSAANGGPTVPRPAGART